jgi:hypothetical protein
MGFTFYVAHFSYTSFDHPSFVYFFLAAAKENSLYSLFHASFRINCKRDGAHESMNVTETRVGQAE